MPVTVATSFLVISLNSLVRPHYKHRDAALLFARSGAAGGGNDSDGDEDSNTDSGSDSEEDPTSRYPPTTAHSTSTSQSRSGIVMSAPQTSGVGPVTAGGSSSAAQTGGVTIVFNTTSTPISLTTAPSKTLPYFSQTEGSIAAFTTSNGTVVPVSSSTNNPSNTSNASSSGFQLSNGTIVGIVLGIVVLGALIWMLIAKICTRRRRARKLPRGFIPSTILVDNQSFRGSVTELPIAGTTNTTSSASSPGRGGYGGYTNRALSISPFAALSGRRISSPSPLPSSPQSGPQAPPGLGGSVTSSGGYLSYFGSRRASQTPSSYSNGKALSSHREEPFYPEADPLYLAMPQPAPASPAGWASSGPHAAVE
ncbi:hypothetical protein DFP72DRAFT_527371 [Ephemerocybe angulata]|uniref:Uncharacterized protein n=1 Tax=Ephemerocybe angulata TaxID=980116 RepID=A0A8H6IG46_9AGAR|nr:hypothetical protein DFP72DRAFT_527371 [Tulosesus angulatus]